MNLSRRKTEQEEWREALSAQGPEQLAKVRRLLLMQYPPFRNWLAEEEGFAAKFFEERGALNSTNDIETQLFDAAYSHFTLPRSRRWKVQLRPARTVVNKLRFAEGAVTLDFSADSSAGIRAISSKDLENHSLRETLAPDDPFSMHILLDIRADWDDVVSFIRPQWEQKRDELGIRTGRGKQAPFEVSSEDLDLFKLWLRKAKTEDSEIVKMYSENGINKDEKSLLDTFRHRGKSIRKFIDPLNISSDWQRPQ